MTDMTARAPEDLSVQQEARDPAAADVARRIGDDFVPGTSALPFRTGSSVDTRAATTATIAVLALGLADDSQRRAFDYLQRLEWSTQRVRVGIVTDTRAIKAIRPYGWMVEHVMPSSLHQRLDGQPDWSEYAEDRIRHALALMDPVHLLIPGPDGVDRQQHLRLCRDTGIDVPYDLLSR